MVRPVSSEMKAVLCDFLQGGQRGPEGEDCGMPVLSHKSVTISCHPPAYYQTVCPTQGASKPEGKGQVAEKHNPHGTHSLCHESSQWGGEALTLPLCTSQREDWPSEDEAPLLEPMPMTPCRRLSAA